MSDIAIKGDPPEYEIGLDSAAKLMIRNRNTYFFILIGGIVYYSKIYSALIFLFNLFIEPFRIPFPDRPYPPGRI